MMLKATVRGGLGTLRYMVWYTSTARVPHYWLKEGYYLNAIGRSNALLLITCTAGYSFCSTFAQYVLKWATQSPPENLKIYIALYAVISFVAWVATSGTVWYASSLPWKVVVDHIQGHTNESRCQIGASSARTASWSDSQVCILILPINHIPHPSVLIHLP